MSKVEDSLRELVREELKGHTSAPAPDKKQIFWLFLCVANTALVLWLLPETVFNNQRAENLVKVFLWLGSSLFISTFVWFRDRLLALTRGRIVRVALVVAFFVLTLLYISQLNVFTIHPVIEPRDAELIVDGQNVSAEGREDLSLSLNEHRITVQPPGWLPQNSSNQYPQPRTFKLSTGDVFSAWWRGEKPRWPLVYDVYVQASGPIDEVIVRSVGQNLDPVFVAKPESPLSPEDLAVPVGAPLANARELVYQWHGASDATFPLRLPYGKYVIFSRKKTCQTAPIEVEVDVPLVKNRTTVLTEPCPQNQ